MGRKNRRKQVHIRPLSRQLIVRPKRMEIWYAALPLDRRTSIQGGSRPVVIVSNDICNEKSNAVTVAPVTRQIKHLEMPTHVLIMDGDSMVLAEQIMTIDKRFLDRRIGDCKGQERQIEKALMEQIGIKNNVPPVSGGKEEV